MVAEAELLRVRAALLPGGARWVDCGIDAAGGMEAGRRMAEACLGGLGTVSLGAADLGGLHLPAVVVRTDHPALACLGSQYAGWELKPDGYYAMASGPLRAVARVEEELFGTLGYAEAPDGPAVVALEGRTPPTEAVARHLAERSGVEAERLSILIAPTASPAGSVQVAARVVETALSKLMRLGLDVGRVVSAFGTAPVAPVAASDELAIGRTNDCILYGGTVHLTIRAGEDELESLAPRVPSSASADCGTPFAEIFERYDHDFYRIDPLLFSPAEVYLTALPSGRTFHAGGWSPEVLRRSLLG